VVAGLLAKGLVESIFEKYRVATLLGLTLGMLRAMATSPSDAAGDEREPEPRRAYGALSASS
jgi:predicted transcriptional regulator